MLESFRHFLNEAVGIWFAGGWAMYGIAVIATVLYSIGIHLDLSLVARRIPSPKDSRWKEWISNPQGPSGHLGRVLERLSAARDKAELGTRYEELLAAEITPLQRDLRVMQLWTSAAPLVGLLGTVTGMLGTFGALSSGAGGDQTMGMVASGISEALITTETGLVIALPGLLYHHRLSRLIESHRASLMHIESLLSQRIHRELSARRRTRIDAIAKTRIAARVLACGVLARPGPHAQPPVSEGREEVVKHAS